MVDMTTQKVLAGIETREQLAVALGVQYDKHLVYNLYRLPDGARYTKFKLSKKSGGEREISVPRSGLKYIQRKLLVLLELAYGTRTPVHGFVKGRDILSNANLHLRPRYLLNIDIKDFFDSINFGRLYGLLRSGVYGANHDVATLVTQICCFENKLPQGAPTSPIVSNMVCGRLDSELKKLAAESRCTYSRYCDDITFSTDRQLPEAIASIKSVEGVRVAEVSGQLEAIVKANGFALNPQKTRLRMRSERQVVTGLVVNRFANLDRRYIRNVRAALHALEKFGADACDARFAEGFAWRLSHAKGAVLQDVLFGRIQYVGHVRGYDDPIYRKFRDQFNALSSRQIPVHLDSWEFKLEQAIWLLEDDDKAIQATAFFLAGVGLITCAHCVGDKPYIARPADSTHYPVKVLAKNDEIDLAILTSPLVPQSEFISAKAFESLSVQTGDEILLAGYPSYGAGKSLSLKKGNIQSIQMKSGVRTFNISAHIIAGNSGGPVFDGRRRVIGVAYRGAKSDDESGNVEEHGVIPIAVLKEVHPVQL